MLQRHSLVRVADRGWDRVLAGLCEPDRHEAAAWKREGWPVVVRRQEDAGMLDEVAVGLPLMPDANGRKRRIALVFNKTEITSVQDPLTLGEVLDAAAPAWRPALKNLHADCVDKQLVVQVYGALAWQALTGLAYLREHSDIDLLLRPDSPAQLAEGITLLSDFSTRLPLDGEIIFPDGHAVAWREWQQTASSGRESTRILVKHMCSARLARPSELLECFSKMNKAIPC